MLSENELQELQAESAVMVQSLLQLTRQGILTWNCAAYEPPALIDANELFISHKLTAETEYDGACYHAEIYEILRVLTGKGDADVSVRLGEEPKTREEVLERCFKFCPEQLSAAFADEICRQLRDSEHVRSCRWKS